MTSKNHLEALSSLGIKAKEVFSNLHADLLEQHSLDKNMAVRTSHGAIAVNTGKFTGRSPEDRFIVKDDLTENSVWWGPINKPFSPEKFQSLKSKVCAYLNDKDVYVRDAYAGSHPSYKLENSNLSSVYVSDELSHPIKGLFVGFLVSYSKIHLSVLPVPDCIGFLFGI